jgi:hypothetical protein
MPLCMAKPFPFATPGKADVWGGFGGLAFEWRTRNVIFFSIAEHLALRAGLRVGF